ncbi:MAG: hypothetical protein ACREUG_09175 [Steroidobacteraceae bacterium]
MNGFSVGRDVTLTVVTGAGPLGMGLITNFKKKQTTKEDMEIGIDGVPRPMRFFQGWSGTFDIDREDASLDEYFNQLEADYYAGVTESPVTITETITNPDGSISQYQYVDVLFKFDEAGDVAGDKIIKQQCSFIASRRLTLA